MRSLTSQSPAESLPDLEDRLAQVESLAAAAPDRETFARELVRMTLGATGGVGAQLWETEGDLPPRLLQQSFLTPESVREAAAQQEAILTALRGAVAARETHIALPASQAEPGPDAVAANPTLFYWIVSPIRRQADVYAVLFVWLESDWDPHLVQRMAELVDSQAQLAVAWFEQQQLQHLRADNRFWVQVSTFLEHLHAETSLDEVSYTAANGVRTLLNADRVWILLKSGRSCRMLAVSGVQQPDHRSNQIRSLRKLAGALSAASLPLSWTRGQPLEVAPSLKVLANTYLDESHLAALHAVPLMRPASGRTPARCLGMLFVERFTPPDGQPERDVNPLAGQVAVALQNARDWQLAPLASRLRSWRRSVQTPWLKWLSVMALLAAGVAALCLVPADFTVEARGELRPARRQHIFASEDGTIEQLKIRTGDTVRRGQPLIVLRNLALEQELQRVTGELETTQRRMASLEAQRLDFESNPDRPASQRLQVTAELEELRVSQASLLRQQALLEKRQALLLLESPLSGQVQTWDVEQLLNGRPVRRGQQLLTVADTSGDWLVEVQIPDARTGDVLDAQRTEKHRPLAVEFAVATDPGRIHRGTLARISMSTETRDTAAGPGMLAEVELDRAAIPDLRAGARVTARIHCGQRPLGYVWFIDAWRAIQRWVLF